MGISNKSHSKKSDKETQSPVLKLFRDMMQKEKHDPEKTNLLKSKGEKKKKKHSGSRSKSNKSIASTCTDRQDASYKGNHAASLLNAVIDPIRTQSNVSPFQGEKRESWWFWGDTADKPVSDETCSCVSCALKKLINTDYACIACLILLFTVSVLVAFLLVYKSIPCVAEKLGSGKVEADRPKRKIKGLSGMRWDQLEKDSGGPNWDSGSSFGVPRSMDVPNIQDLGSLIDSNSDLAKMLDKDLMSEIQNSDKLREFYKKLIKTDAQIQNLKKNNELNVNNIENINKYGIYPERAKRSLKIFHRPLKLFHFKRNKHIRENKLHEKDKTNNNNKNAEVNDKSIASTKESNQKNTKSARYKRFDNTSEPEGFLIENKKVMIRYKPNRKSKCSHTPKESKSHETQLKHPFYQNTQRLDELLDRFLGKNLPELLDPFGLDLLYEKEKKCKHPKLTVDKEVTTRGDNDIKNNKATTAFNEKDLEKFKNVKENTKMFKAESNTVHDLFAELEVGDGVKRETTTNSYGLIMSVSTMMYPDIFHSSNINIQRTTYSPLIDRVPNARKLLQTDADDDMNEVIVDANDDPDDRKKRVGESHMSLPGKKNPASIINPNWKGPMPLYPDELNSMMKQDTTMNRVENPVHNKYNPETNEEPVVNSKRKYVDVNENIVETPLNKDTLSETDDFDANLNDMDYIEDYFRNKYDRLVEMAQAYSDYGVLEGKKSTDKVDEKGKSEVSDRRIKLSLSGLKKGLKNSIFGRSKKGNQDNPSDIQNAQSEGFRLEFKPTSATREDNPTDIYKTLQKHLKIAKANTQDDPQTANIQDASVQNFELLYTPKASATKPNKKSERGVIFSLGKGKRSLKSVDIEEPESDKSEPIYDPSIKKIYDEIEYDTIVDIDAKNVFENVNLRLKREADSNVLTTEVTMDKAKLDSETQTNKNATLSDFDEEIIHDLTNTENVLNHEVSKKSLPIDKLSIDESVKNNGNENRLNLTDESSYKTDNMSLSNFFMLLSNWFSALDGVDIKSSQIPNENLSTNKTKELTNNSEITYPIYDSDMIENIGHRSRVLLSVEDVNSTTKEQVDKQADSITDKNANITNDILKTTNIENKTKSIVKRNVDDSNLIFWNDLYDDEYGVVDNTENVREKYSIKNDLIKKPNDWLRDKVKMIADGFHKKVENLNRNIDVKGIDKVVKDGVKIKHKEAISNRFSRNVGAVPKTDFSALTANMRKICRKAAKDVAIANKVDERDVSKEGQVTSTLMQQLVRLMGDLVDYQVKQRTCRKLPADLQNFLEWLTSSVSDAEADKYIAGFKTDEFSSMDFDKINPKSEDHALDTVPEREEKPNTRSDCLGTLQSVQALMKQYEDMTDDDKSKMTGVKEYLETQMQYLQKQITSSNDFNQFNTDPIRFRRDVSKTQNDQKPKKRRRRLKQFFSNLIKKLGRKHRKDKNKSTVTNNNAVSNVDKDVSKVKNILIKKGNSEKDNGIKTVKEKRNLRDVYYKAIGDAKKLTTVKSN